MLVRNAYPVHVSLKAAAKFLNELCINVMVPVLLAALLVAFALMRVLLLPIRCL